MSLKSLFSTLFLTVFFLSCKKSNDDRQQNVTTIPVLQKVFGFDTTLAAPHDTISRILISYDGNGRVSFVTKFNTKTNGDTLDYNTFQYFYVGTDSIASRTIWNSSYAQGYVDNKLDTTDYTYSGGKLVYDSTYRRFYGITPEYSARNISYYPDHIGLSIQSYLGSAGISFTNTANIYQTIAGGNILTQLDTSMVASPGQQFSDRYFSNNSYISNFNPLYVLTKPIKQDFINLYYDFYFPSHNDELESLLAQVNFDYKHWGYGGNATGNSTTSYSYVFRPDGYPSESRKTFTPNGPPVKTKYIYIYQ